MAVVAPTTSLDDRFVVYYGSLSHRLYVEFGESENLLWHSDDVSRAHRFSHSEALSWIKAYWGEHIDDAYITDVEEAQLSQSSSHEQSYIVFHHPVRRDGGLREYIRAGTSDGQIHFYNPRIRYPVIETFDYRSATRFTPKQARQWYISEGRLFIPTTLDEAEQHALIVKIIQS